MIEYPSSVSLARRPTPLQRIERLPKRHGLSVELWIKRDDLTGAEMSGNKVRKLEFLMEDARRAAADTLITCGGEQSNHARATALAGAKLGLSSVLLLRTADPQSPPAAEGNILLDRLAGAEIRWITPAEYAERTALMDEVARDLRSAGRKPYIIPEGGSNAIGAWGYVRCMEEICGELQPPLTVVYACGSGGTGAGLLLGRELLGQDQIRIVGVCVCDDAAYFQRVIGKILADSGKPLPPDQIEILEGYVGRGYAKSRPEEIDALIEMTRTEGLVLDPVYSGKAWFGLLSELERDPARFGPRVVFIHTGGIFGLLGKSAEVAPRL